MAIFYPFLFKTKLHLDFFLPFIFLNSDGPKSEKILKRECSPLLLRAYPKDWLITAKTHSPSGTADHFLSFVSFPLSHFLSSLYKEKAIFLLDVEFFADFQCFPYCNREIMLVLL